MQLYYFSQNEFIKNSLRYKEAKNTFGTAIGCSMLMLALLFIHSLFSRNFFDLTIKLLSYVSGFFVSALSPHTFETARSLAYSFLNTRESAIIFSIIVFIVIIIVPFLILAKRAGLTLLGGFRVNTRVPNKFWLYAPFTIGVGFSVNIIVQLLFGDAFGRYNDTAASYPDSISGIILFFVFSAFVPAIFEEWAFRGILQRSLMPYGKGFALITSSVLFGAMHIEPPRVIFATTFGLLAGFLYLKTGTIWYGVLIHLINNTYSVTVQYVNQFRGIITEDIISGELQVVTVITLLLILSGVIGTIYFLYNSYFKLRIMRYKKPPEKSKLSKAQLAGICLLNGTTVAFVCFYLIILAVLYF